MLSLWKKSYDQLRQHTKKHWHYFADKVHLVKAMVFPVVMYGCESWTIKKAEHRRIDAFELWCWRRLLRIAWTARRSNQSILKEISPKYSLEGLMLKLKLQSFGHLMRRTDPDAGKHWRREEKEITEDEMVGWHHWLNGHEFEQALGVGDGQGGLACCSPWSPKEWDWVTELTEPTICIVSGKLVSKYLFFFLIEVKLLYNVVLVSAVQGSESVLHIPISAPSLACLPPHPSRSWCSTQLSTSNCCIYS